MGLSGRSYMLNGHQGETAAVTSTCPKARNKAFKYRACLAQQCTSNQITYSLTDTGWSPRRSIPPTHSPFAPRSFDDGIDGTARVDLLLSSWLDRQQSPCDGEP
jgi:hypothetical protein